MLWFDVEFRYPNSDKLEYHLEWADSESGAIAFTKNTYGSDIIIVKCEVAKSA